MSLGVCLKKCASSNLSRFAWYNVKIRTIFSVRFESRKVDKKKQTCKKTEAYKLYSRVFWIFLWNGIKIDSYNFDLYRFKVGTFFFETQLVATAQAVIQWLSALTNRKLARRIFANFSNGCRALSCSTRDRTLRSSGCDKSCWRPSRFRRETYNLRYTYVCVETGTTMLGRFYHLSLQLSGQRIHFLAMTECTLSILQQHRCSHACIWRETKDKSLM